MGSDGVKCIHCVVCVGRILTCVNFFHAMGGIDRLSSEGLLDLEAGHYCAVAVAVEFPVAQVRTDIASHQSTSCCGDVR